MKIRKTAITALCVVCAVFALSAFASCGLFSPKEADCDHEWGQWAVLTPAGCEEDGLQTRTCTLCGETEDEVIPATGHTPGRAYTFDESGHGTTCTVCGEVLESEPHTYDDGQTSKAATCTEPGEKLYSCTVCGWSYVEATDPLGHNYVAVRTVPPTCFEEGYTEYVCTRCGDSYEDDYTAPRHTLGDEFTSDENGHSGVCIVCGEELESESHTWRKETTEPTCTEDGETVYTCTVCGYSRSETIAATGHSYVTEVVKPTCTEDGYTRHTCTVCGDVCDDEFVSALGHAYVREVTQEATCTVDGMAKKTCQRCGDVYYETIEATGHRYDYNIDSHDDTYHWKECLVCGEMDFESYDRHSYDATTMREATCTVDGEILYVCNECGYSYTMTVNATGHDYRFVELVNPTCEDYGYTIYKCANCGDEYEEIDYFLTPTGHDWSGYNNWYDEDSGEYYHYQICANCGEYAYALCSFIEYGTAVTCTSDGTFTRICMICGYTYTETTPALGHTPSDGVAVEKLYDDTNGYRHIFLCANCGTYVVESCTFVYDETLSTAATCTVEGYDVYSCPICGVVNSTYTEEIGALGHDYEASVTDPTCTEEGYTTHTCTRCGDSYTGDYTDPLGHDYVGEVTKEATCQETGEMTYTCRRCGYTYTEDIAATPDQHTYDEDPAKRTYVYDSTKGEDNKGAWGYVCDVCGKYVAELEDAEGVTLYINDSTVGGNASAALASALTYDGVTVVLEIDVTMSADADALAVAEYTTVTLDLGGKTLTLSGAMENEGTLYIVDTVVSGKITIASDSDAEALIKNSGTLYLGTSQLSLGGVTLDTGALTIPAVLTTAGDVTVTGGTAFAARTGIEIDGGDLNLEKAAFQPGVVYPVYAVGGTLNLYTDAEVYLQSTSSSPVNFNFADGVTVSITVLYYSSIGSTLFVDEGVTVTLDLGRYSLTLAPLYSDVLVVENKGTMEIKGYAAAGTRQLYANTEVTPDYAVENHGTMTLTDVYLKSMTDEAQDLVYNAGTLDVVGGRYLASGDHFVLVNEGDAYIYGATVTDENYSASTSTVVPEDTEDALIANLSGTLTIEDSEIYAYTSGIILYGGTLVLDGGLLATTFETSAASTGYYYTVYVPDGAEAAVEIEGAVTMKDGIGVAYGGGLELTVNGTLSFDGYYEGHGSTSPSADNIPHDRPLVENYGTMYIDGSGTIEQVNYGTKYGVTELSNTRVYYLIRNFGEMTISDVTVTSPYTDSALITNGWYQESYYTGDDHAGDGNTGEPVYLTIEGGDFSGGKYVVKNDYDGYLTINGGTFTAVKNINERSGAETATNAVVCNLNVACITGGTFDGTYATVATVYDRIKDYDGYFEQGIITVEGGTFYGTYGVYLTDGDAVVEGGDFAGCAYPVYAVNGTLTAGGVDVYLGNTEEGDGVINLNLSGADTYVTLLGDATLGSTLQIGDAENTSATGTLNLNGYSLTLASGSSDTSVIVNYGTVDIIGGSQGYNQIYNNASDPKYMIENYGTMTITDLRINSSKGYEAFVLSDGCLTVSGSSFNGAGTYLIESYGTLTIENSDLTIREGADSAAAVFSSGDASIADSAITANAGDGIYLTGGTLTLSDMTALTAGDGCYPVYAAEGDTAVTIEGGVAVESAVYVESGAALTLILGAGATLTSESGASAIVNRGTAEITGYGTITFASGLSNSGITYLVENLGTMTISGEVTIASEYTGNSLVGNGWHGKDSYDGDGDTATLLITGGTLTGSGFTVRNGYAGVLAIEGGTLSGSNNAAVYNIGDATISGGTFDGSAGNYAVYNNSTDANYDAVLANATLTIAGGEFYGGEKAALYVAAGAACVTGGTFTGTYGLFLAGGDLDVEGGTFDSAYPVYAENGTLNLYAGVDVFLGSADGADGIIYLNIYSGKAANITLLESAVIGSSLLIDEGAEATIDLGGFTLKLTTGYDGEAVIENLGTVTVIGGGAKENQLLGGTADPIENYGEMTLTGLYLAPGLWSYDEMVMNAEGASLTVEGGTYSANGSATAFYNAGTLSVTEATIRNTGYTGGVTDETDALIVSGGYTAIFGGSLDALGTAVYLTGGTLTLSDTDPEAGDGYYPVYAAEGNAAIAIEGEVTIKNSIYVAEGAEAGIAVGEEATLTAGSAEVSAIVNYGTAEIEGEGTITYASGLTNDDVTYLVRNFGDMTISGVSITSSYTHTALIENGWYSAADYKADHPAPEEDEEIVPDSLTATEGFATLTIESGYFYGGHHVVKNDYAGILDIEGGSFVGTDTSVIYNLNYATIEDGSFDGTGAKYVIRNYASPVVEYYHDPYLAVSGGYFTGGTAETVSVECGCVEISGGRFQAVGDTNVIKVTGGELLISDGTFVASTDEDAEGYCVYIVDGDVTVSGGTFIGNGIYGEATLTGGDLQGGIVYTGGTVTVSSSSTVYLEEGTYDEIIINTAEADIELLGSITIATTLVVPEGSTLTLDLAGYAITLISDEAGAVIENHGTLTIVGGYASGNQIKNQSSDFGEYLIENYGDMALESLYLSTTNKYTALVYNAEGAALTIEGGTYSACGTYTIENAGSLTATNAAFTVVSDRSPSAAVIASSGDVEIIGGSIKTDAAAALYVTGGTLTLTDLTVTTNENGYPVYVAGTGVCVTINETVTVNGTIYVEAGAEAILKVEGTLTQSAEASIIVNYGTIVISGEGQITLTETGITYFIENYGDMTISEVAISSPYATTTSRLIMNGWTSATDCDAETAATLTIESGTFEGAYGIVENGYMGVLNITGGTFTALDGSNAIIVNSGDAEISGGEFDGTGANYVIYKTVRGGVGSLTISDGEFYGGTTATLYIAWGDVEISGGTFTAAEDGYAVYVTGGTVEIKGGEFYGSAYGAYIAGAAAAISGGTFTATGEEGSALYIASGTAEVSGGTFSGMYGIYLADGDLYVEGGTFTGAAYGVYVVKGTLTLAMDGVEAYLDAADSSVINLILEKDTVATVTLLDSVTLGSQIYVGEGQTLTLDLGGYSLTLASGSSDTSVIVNYGTVDIIGGSLGKNQIYNNASNPEYMIENYGTMTITDLRINSSKEAYEAFVLSDGGLTVSGSSFNGSGTYLIESHGTLTIENSDLTIKGTDSAAVIASSGETSITDSAITASAGNGIYLTDGTLTLDGVTITAATGCYAIYVAEGDVTITMSGDVVENDAIYVAVDASADITVDDGAALTSASGASAIVNYGTAEISGAGTITFADEIETEGILISNFGTMTITGNPEISSPYANSTLVDNGWSTESTYKADNPSAIDEETGDEILSDVVATLTIEGGGFTGGQYVIRNNRAGELYITGGTFTAVDGTYCLVLNVNYAEISGGEFYGEFEVGDDDDEGDVAFAKYVIYSRSNSADGPTALGQGYMKISGGEFYGGTYANLYATGESTVDVYGGAFTESGSGNSVYADNNAVITIYAGSFYGENGTVQKNGGQIINIGGSFGESGVTVTGGDYVIYTSDTVYISATCDDPINIKIESDEANVVLIGDTVLGSTLVVHEGKTLNIDLGSYTLKLCSSDDCTAIIDNRGTLNVYGGSVTTCSECTGALILNTGCATLTGVTMTNETTGATLIENGEGATLVLDGGTFTAATVIDNAEGDIAITIDGEVAVSGTIITEAGASVALTVNGTLTESKSAQLIVNYGDMTISGEGEMTFNATPYIAYFIQNYGEMTISGVTVSSAYNTSPSSLIYNGWATVSDYRTANGEDADVVATLEIEDGSFSGGNIIVNNGYMGVLYITGGEFVSHENTNSIISNHGEATVSGGTFDGTNATYAFVNTSIAGDSTMTISGVEVYGGTAAALYVAYGEVTVTGGTFTAEVEGSYAAYVSGGTLYVLGGEFSGEVYGVYLYNGDLYVEGGSFYGNTYPIYAVAGVLTVSADAEIYLADSVSMDALTIEGGTVAITLLGNVTLGSKIYVGEGADATIDIGANKLDTATTGFDDAVMMENHGTLTIYGSASTTTNQFANYGGAAMDVLVKNYGTMNLKDVFVSTTLEYDALIFNDGDLVIEGGYYNAQNAAYVIENEGTLEISNASLVARASGTVKAVIASSGDASITDSAITANVGNGIYLTGGTLTLDGVTITAATGCYAIYVAEGDVTITMSGDVVEDDAIYVAVDASADITVDDGATLTSSSGASAIVNYGTAEISGEGAITYAEGATPAAELIVNYGEMTIGGVEVYSTSTDKDLIANGWTGQGAYGEDENVQIQTLNITGDGFASLTIEGGTFSGGNNVIRNRYAGQLEIKGGEFSAIAKSNAIVYNVNVATISGGTFTGADLAYYVVSNNVQAGDLSSGTLTVSGGTLTGGSTAVVKTSGGYVTISKGTVTAEGDAYGVYITGGTLTVSGGTIDGDIYNEGGSVEVTGGTVGETTTASGEVVISSSGTVYIGSDDESEGVINITIEATTANVMLVGNVTLGQLIYVPEKKTLNLDLGIYALTLSDDATYEVVIENAGTLNLTGSWTTDDECGITDSQISGAATFITNSGTATLTGVYLAASEDETTVVESSKTLTVSASSLSSAVGNAVEITGGTLTLTNAEIDTGTDPETYTGSAVYVSGNSVTVTVSGDATTVGAAICVAEGVTGMTLTVSGTLLSNGATAVENHGTMTMSGSGTTAYAENLELTSGTLVSNFGTMTITGGTIRSDYTGSEVYVVSNGWSSAKTYGADGVTGTATLTINNANAKLIGGGDTVRNRYAGVLTISNGTFTAIDGTSAVLYNQNEASVTGAATFDGTYATYTVVNAPIVDEDLEKSALTISNASAKFTGGTTATLYVRGGTLTVNNYNATVTAADGASALYVTGGTASVLNGTYTATDGRAVYVTGGSVEIKGGTYKGAYGVYLDGGDATISSGTFTNADIKVFAASGTLTDSANTTFNLGASGNASGLNLYISKSGTINIYLDGDVVLGSTFEIASNQTVNLYLYGHTLTLSTEYDTDTSVINNKGTLNVYGGWTDDDENAVETSQITGGETLIVNSGTLTLSGVYIAEGTEENPVTIVESSKTLTVSASSLSNANGDAVKITAGTLTLTNAYVDAGSDDYTGYAVYVESSSGTVTITISSGTVTLGSAIYVAQGTVTLTVTGTLLSNGATAVENHGTTNISSSGKITYADGLDSVKYLIANMGTMTITGVTVSSEYYKTTLISNGWTDVTEHDGSSSAKLTISGGTYEGGCYTVRNGYAGELTVSGGTFNTIAGQQAILYNLNYTKVSGGTFNGDLSKYVVYNAKSTYNDEDYYKAEFETSGTSATFNGGTVATLFVTGGTVTISTNVKFYATQDESGEYSTVVMTSGTDCLVKILSGTFYGAFEGEKGTIEISGGTLTNITSCICKYITGSAKCPMCGSDCTCADDECGDDCGCND